MTTHTIEAHGRPVVVVGVGDTPALEDSFATRPELLQTLRATRNLEERLRPDMREHMRKRAIAEAFDTWLGEDLSTLESGGRSLWDGDRDALRVREASADEAAIFRASREQAIREGELEAGDEDWVGFLVPVTDSADDGEEEDEGRRAGTGVVRPACVIGPRRSSRLQRRR
jgi:hypothetical protein